MSTPATSVGDLAAALLSVPFGPDTRWEAEMRPVVETLLRERGALLAGCEKAERHKRALESILVRCEEGDPRSNWLPIIANLARDALASSQEIPT